MTLVPTVKKLTRKARLQWNKTARWEQEDIILSSVNRQRMSTKLTMTRYFGTCFIFLHAAATFLGVFIYCRIVQKVQNYEVRMETVKQSMSVRESVAHSTMKHYKTNCNDDDGDDDWIYKAPFSHNFSGASSGKVMSNQLNYLTVNFIKIIFWNTITLSTDDGYTTSIYTAFFMNVIIVVSVFYHRYTLSQWLTHFAVFSCYSL